MYDWEEDFDVCPPLGGCVVLAAVLLRDKGYQNSVGRAECRDLQVGKLNIIFVEGAVFSSVRILVCLSSGFLTCRYLHEQQAKKNEPTMSWVVACCVSVMLACAMRDNTLSGIAFY
jgi:hypothetical protein